MTLITVYLLLSLLAVAPAALAEESPPRPLTPPTAEELTRKLAEYDQALQDLDDAIRIECSMIKYPIITPPMCARYNNPGHDQ